MQQFKKVDDNFIDHVFPDDAGGSKKPQFLGRQAPTKYGNTALYYDSKKYPGVTFTFTYKRALKNGTNAVRCIDCQVAQRQQKRDHRPKGVVHGIIVDGMEFLIDPDEYPHICLAEGLLTTTSKANGKKIYREVCHRLRHNPMQPTFAMDHLKARLAIEHPNEYDTIVDSLPPATKLKRIFRLNSNRTAKAETQSGFSMLGKIEIQPLPQVNVKTEVAENEEEPTKKIEINRTQIIKKEKVEENEIVSWFKPTPKPPERKRTKTL